MDLYRNRNRLRSDYLLAYQASQAVEQLHLHGYFGALFHRCWSKRHGQILPSALKRVWSLWRALGASGCCIPVLYGHDVRMFYKEQISWTELKQHRHPLDRRFQQNRGVLHWKLSTRWLWRKVTLSRKVTLGKATTDKQMIFFLILLIYSTWKFTFKLCLMFNLISLLPFEFLPFRRNYINTFIIKASITWTISTQNGPFRWLKC